MFKNTCVSRNLKSILSWYETYLWRAGQDRIFFLGMLTQQICNLQERAFSNFIQRLEIQDEPSSPAVPVFCLHLQETKVLYTRAHVNYTAYIHLLAQEVRHRVKSPAKRAKPITNSGIGTLPNGTKFIKYWPSDRKPADLRTCPRQSLKEAAKWCKEVPTHSRPVRWNLNIPTSLLNSDFVFIYFKGGSTQCSTNSFLNEYFTDLLYIQYGTKWSMLSQQFAIRTFPDRPPRELWSLLASLKAFLCWAMEENCVWLPVLPGAWL